MDEVEIKPAQPLPEFGALPKVVEEKPEPKTEEAPAKPNYTAQTIIIALLILACAVFWKYGLKPDLDWWVNNTRPVEVKQ